MEWGLRRRLEGVATISISQSRQTAVVEFAEGPQRFSPRVFRDVLDESGVEVVAFQIDACGTIEQRQNQRWLVAGDNRFLLEEDGTVPVGQPLCVSARLDDRADPHRLKVTAIQSVPN